MTTRILIFSVVLLALGGLALPLAQSSDGSKSSPSKDASSPTSAKQPEALDKRLGDIEAQLKKLDKVLERLQEQPAAKTAEAGDADGYPTVAPKAPDPQVAKLKRELASLKLQMERMNETMSVIAEPPDVDKAEAPAPPPRAAPTVQKRDTGHSLKEIGFSISVLLFGCLIICLVLYFVLKHRKEWDVWSVQIVILTLIIVPGAFLITAGYGQQQITPLVGLLGTVAGYLLGQKDPQTGQRTGGVVGGIVSAVTGHPQGAPAAPQQASPQAAAAPRPAAAAVTAPAPKPAAPAAGPAPASGPAGSNGTAPASASRPAEATAPEKA
jgi:hypothetical protein